MGHTILDRRLQFNSSETLSAQQIHIDSALRHFNEQASDPIALASMTAASLSFKASRLLFFEMAAASKLKNIAGPLFMQSSANLFALSVEVSAFRASSNFLTQVKGQTPLNDVFDAKGWTGSFVDFFSLKTAGVLCAGQNVFLTHFAQANALVFGHELSAHWGFIDVQKGNYIEKLAAAEASNMALSAGIAFVHRLSPRFTQSEKRREAETQAFHSSLRLHSFQDAPSPLRAMTSVEKPQAPKIELKSGAVPEGRIDMWGEKLFKDSKSSWLKPTTWRLPSRILQDLLLNEMLRNEPIKKRMIALLDAITSAPDASVRDLLRQYFPKGGQNASGLLRVALNLGVARFIPDTWVVWGIRMSLRSMAHRFLAGENTQSAIHHALTWRSQGVETTLDVVQENVLSAREANEYTETVLQLIRDWTQLEHLPARTQGGVPVRHISVKLSGMTHRLDPVAHYWAIQDAGARLLKIFKAAKSAHDSGKPVMINVDLEDSSVRDMSYKIFWQALKNPELQDWQDAAIVVQVYDRQSESTFLRLLEKAKQFNKKIQVRLVKGAYHSFEQIRAQRHGWPIPVFMSQMETDQNFRRLARLALENHEIIRPAFGSHNLEDIAYVQALRGEMGLPIEVAEHQFLRGVGNHLAAAMVRNKIPARFYGPFGSQANALGYMVRRLDEVKLNSAIGQTHFSGSWRQYRANKQKQALAEASHAPKSQAFVDFRPEAEVDLSQAGTRHEMSQALEQARQGMPRAVTPLIGEYDYARRHILPEIYTNPAHWTQEVSKVWNSTPYDVLKAIRIAQRGYESWANKTGTERAEILITAADTFGKLRYFFAALLVVEASKPWHLALAEVNEGIDFLRAYAAAAHGISQTRSPLGVGVAIAPFNFPFGILIGEIAGGLAAGNAMLVKPSEQTSLIAFEAVKLLRKAGVPADALQLLPGDGSVGAALVESPLIDFVIFTGSVETAARIAESARLHPSLRHGHKVLVLETGGKNAALVAASADLDVAVRQTLDGAFQFAGQRCSAVSRVFVVDSIADAFIDRLSEGAVSMIVKDPIHPETQVGSLIDIRAQQKIHAAISEGIRWAGNEANVFHAKGGTSSHMAHFVKPWIFVGTDPKDPFVQTEHFGPLLAVIRVKDFEAGLRLANDSAYGLTAALFSRNPQEVSQFLSQIEVGNAYVNRSPTGALVRFQPFGASHPRKDSGTGPKAGGSEYVIRFTTPHHAPIFKGQEILQTTPPVTNHLGTQLNEQQKAWAQVDADTRIAWAQSVVRELRKGYKFINASDRQLLIDRIQTYIYGARMYLHRRVTLEKRGELNEEAHDWPNGIGYILGEGENSVDFVGASVAALLMGNAIVLSNNPRAIIVQKLVTDAAQGMPKFEKLQIPLLITSFSPQSILNDRQIDFLVAQGPHANSLFGHFLARLPGRNGFRRVIGGHMDSPSEALYLTRFSSARTRSEETLRHGAELNLR